MNIKLFSYYRSSCSYRVRIGLNLKELEYEYIPVHLVRAGGEQHSATFTAHNSMNQVPYFIHDDVALSQSMAILKYIDETWKQPAQLFSNDIKVQAKQIELAEIINAGIQPIQNLSVLKKLAIDFTADKSQTAAWSKHWIESGFKALESELIKTSGTYCFGDKVSIVDLFLIPQVYNANRFEVNLTNYPTIDKINAHCLNQGAFMSAHPENQQDTPEELKKSF